MGFTMGFLSGLALISTTTYLTLLTHRLHRSQQSLSLRQQRTVLDNIVDPPTPYAVRNTRRELYAATTPEERAALGRHGQGVVELAKEGWNRQIEELVRRVENADYAALRERAEELGGRVWRRVREGVADAGR